jgi:hypothetical protein
MYTPCHDATDCKESAPGVSSRGYTTGSGIASAYMAKSHRVLNRLTLIAHDAFGDAIPSRLHHQHDHTSKTANKTTKSRKHTPIASNPHKLQRGMQHCIQPLPANTGQQEGLGLLVNAVCRRPTETAGGGGVVPKAFVSHMKPNCTTQPTAATNHDGHASHD